MNVRFAEPCREVPLAFEDKEEAIQIANDRDGRTQKELALTCQKDIQSAPHSVGVSHAA